VSARQNPIGEVDFRARIQSGDEVFYSRAYSTRAPAARAGSAEVSRWEAALAHYERFKDHPRFPARHPGAKPVVSIETSSLVWTEEGS
jgi:hypothetical protein